MGSGINAIYKGVEVGIKVSDKTFLECDRCRKQSESSHDQIVAVRISLARGWLHSSIDGKVLCPECRRALKVGIFFPTEYTEE